MYVLNRVYTSKKECMIENEYTLNVGIDKKRLNQYFVQTHSLGKQIIHTYLERCLFRLLQASSSTISFSQILHFWPFKGLRLDFLTRINFQGILDISIVTKLFVKIKFNFIL